MLRYREIPIPTTLEISIAPRLDIGHFVAQGRCSRDPAPGSSPTALLLMEAETTKTRSGLFFPFSF